MREMREWVNSPQQQKHTCFFAAYSCRKMGLQYKIVITVTFAIKQPQKLKIELTEKVIVSSQRKVIKAMVIRPLNDR